MIEKLGILPQFSIKRARHSRTTLVESAIKPPIRGTSVCRAGLVEALAPYDQRFAKR
jgi:hypothetical protein